ncbi:ATP-grasp fold amidoligase family protein [Butyrivibrio sp. YAB3001]|uniref:ATP-grasp fold amidoligase family protein n=1 Tax=Butyrivibrio sp. YAB3001 TaxID=1520812 RepID=UPI0008F63BD1|nr:ATP-grasp fold amidoligase family protein [Butyrivibrio sp. YAB3001]SFC98406.1 TupA-like ATPgrasp [Butyrivibrio sp. YAB3001]
MVRPEIILHDISAYGVKMAFYHVQNRLNYTDENMTKLLEEKDKQIKRMSIDEKVKCVMAQYKFEMGEKLDIYNPSSFTEKIQYIKLFGIDTDMVLLADKFKAKEKVAKAIGNDHVVKLIGVYDNFSEIDFGMLPKAFCMKVNHGSGMNCVIKNKEKIDIKALNNKFDLWVGRKSYAETFEQQYRDMPPKILVEEYIEGLDGNLNDYKIHCFDGEPLFIQCIGERNLKNHEGFQRNYDLDWNVLDWTFETYPLFKHEVTKPKHLEEMLEIARLLAKGFNYVRVDLYDTEDEVYFGEMTFTPASGLYPYKRTWTHKKDLWLGERIRLDKKQFGKKLYIE